MLSKKRDCFFSRMSDQPYFTNVNKMKMVSLKYHLETR